MTQAIEKPLPQLYREAADLILKHGKTEGDFEAKDGCLCTMGAILKADGRLADNEVTGFAEDQYIHQDPEFFRLIKPVADQIVASGRLYKIEPEDDEDTAGGVAFRQIYTWNDTRNGDSEKTAADVAALLRETADAVERAS